METNKLQEQNSKKLVRHILKLGENIFQGIKLSVPSEWLTSDMTVAQLRILLYLYTDGPSRMSIIASSIGIAVSTATGIVDNLVKKGLVTRSADPEDRRLVICSLSPPGRDTMSMMWTLGQLQMKNLLHGLSVEELEKVNEVAGILLRNVTSTKNPA